MKAVALPDGVRQSALCRRGGLDREVVGVAGLCNGVGCGGEWDAEAALAERARIAVLGFERSEFRSRRGQDATAFGDFGLERSCSGDGSDDGSLRFFERVEGWPWGGAPAFGEVPSACNRGDVSAVVAQDAFEGVAGDVGATPKAGRWCRTRSVPAAPSVVVLPVPAGPTTRTRGSWPATARATHLPSRVHQPRR